jgi:hypothetical protein
MASYDVAGDMWQALGVGVGGADRTFRLEVHVVGQCRLTLSNPR